jgi:nicotinate-nucleotide adenylyltransferase
MTPERTGVLGGRFDPIHCGHLETAAAARRALALHEVLLIPSGLSPHRASAARAPGVDRLAMVTLAAQSDPHLTPSDLELSIDAPSYTSSTLARLHDRGYRRTQLFFIVGADAFAEIATWHDYPAVLEAAHFVVVSRPGYSVAGLAARLPTLRNRMRTIASAGTPLGSGTAPAIWLLDAVTPNVSSTQVRTWLARRQPVTGLVPPAVATYIAHHRLYDGPAMSLHD